MIKDESVILWFCLIHVDPATKFSQTSTSPQSCEKIGTAATFVFIALFLFLHQAYPCFNEEEEDYEKRERERTGLCHRSLNINIFIGRADKIQQRDI